MRILHLPLKEKWYRMIEKGEKKEEYRELNYYWAKRIMKDYPIEWRWRMSICLTANNFDIFLGKKFGGWDAIHFTLGYPKRDDEGRNMTREVEEIIIGEGREEWGAEPHKLYFVIKLKDKA